MREHSWKCKNELINDILLWTPLHGRTSVGQPTRTHLQLLCMDTGCSLEDLLEAMDMIEMNGERESGKSVLAA